MSRDEADAALTGLVAAHDRISAAMYWLDNHPGLTALRRPGLTGRTARVATETLHRTGVLWSRFAALGARLDQARAARAAAGNRPGAAGLRTLTTLLREPCVAAGPDGMIIETGPPTLTLPALAGDLERQAEEVRAVCARVEAAHTAVAERLTPLTTALDRARATASGLGDSGDAGAALADVEARLATAHLAALADPLGGADVTVTTRLRDLAEEVNRIATGLAGLARLRDRYPERLARLARDVDAVAAAEDRAAEVFRVVHEKILRPGLPEPPAAAEALRAHLRQIGEIQREGRWPRLADELAAAERGAATALERAGHLHEAADGLLRRRTELRGRLSAYRAKAARLGLIEDGYAATLHERAETLLYTSPCDLPAATRAVVAYQRALAGGGPEPAGIPDPPVEGGRSR
ncbi:hypothetical protein [Catenuloplanes atrovinosus]|uniref:Uncharacterized protein n=1 Tax=Catenuloplanes atrovinosus TaxID=137266 RepID=A0AAE3YL69_9ACTN|nr:hypothetical protein [Catenuloplanes atrovinosus]MDR7275869.1 hypothetical protein [Catenuloplanes atrovinosus]